MIVDKRPIVPAPHEHQHGYLPREFRLIRLADLCFHADLAASNREYAASLDEGKVRR